MVHFGRWQGPDWFFIGPWIGCGDALSPSLARAQAPNLSARVDPRRVGQQARQDAAAAGAAAARSAAGALLAREYYLALARLDARYDELAAHCAAAATIKGLDPGRIAARVKTLAQDYGDVVSGLLTTESARRRLTRPLRLIAGAYAFRNAAGSPELATFAWVPAADVAQLADDAALQLSFSLLGPTGAPLRVDTTALVRNGFERDGSVLRMAVRWAALPPGDNTRLHVFVGDAREPSRGGYAEQRVPAMSRAAQAMSSVVVAVPGESGPLVRGARHVAPQPGHIVMVGDAFRLFYELYGIAEDTELQTTIRLRRTREDDLEGLLARYTGKRAERELHFREQAVLDSRGVVVRDVAMTGELVPGDYAVEVIVRMPGGDLTGSTALRIREP